MKEKTCRAGCLGNSPPQHWQMPLPVAIGGDLAIICDLAQAQMAILAGSNPTIGQMERGRKRNARVRWN